ncbi:MAG: hypothetical protein R3B72_34770 [Polyangiaceae bacterium]
MKKAIVVGLVAAVLGRARPTFASNTTRQSSRAARPRPWCSLPSTPAPPPSDSQQAVPDLFAKLASGS